MSLRRLLLIVLTAGLVAGTAVSAEAGTVGHSRHVHSIALVPDGQGTLIRITYAGRIRPVVRVIRSREAIDALAVTDIDNDGDLDILASARAGGLVMWRNAGNGHFRLATAPDRRKIDLFRERIGRGRRNDAPVQAGDDRYDAAMPRAPAADIDSPVLTAFVSRFISIPLPVRQRPSGRAPPLHA